MPEPARDDFFLDRSGPYRVRASADEFSEAATRYFINDASRYAGALDKSNRADISGASGYTQRKRIAARGGYVHLVQESSDTGGRQQGTEVRSALG
ncbi:MAG: hypothetical protein ABEN55_15755 [Bradymonadaceae bacterium]